MSFPRKETDIPRRISTSQLRSAIRKVQSKRRQAIQNSNSETRRRNNQVRQNNASRKRAVDAYKREVRAYKTRVRANRARLESALKRRARQPVTVRYTVLHQSALSLANAYDRLDNTRADPFLSDLAEQETANSVALLNSLGDGIQADGAIVNSPIATEIELAHISPELDKRWHGAVYALSPENPDAARHFCVSAREILTRILSIEAPNTDVFYRYPDCETTEGERLLVDPEFVIVLIAEAGATTRSRASLKGISRTSCFSSTSLTPALTALLVRSRCHNSPG